MSFVASKTSADIHARLAERSLPRRFTYRESREAQHGQMAVIRSLSVHQGFGGAPLTTFVVARMLVGDDGR